MGWLQVPNDLVDVWLPHLTGGELKVWLFGYRQTKGFQKNRDTLSSGQIRSGIKKKNGERLNSGTGLSRRAVFQALQGLEGNGLVNRIQRPGTTTVYEFLVPEPVQKGERVPVQKSARVETEGPVHSTARGSAKTAPTPVHSGAPTKEIVGRNTSKDNPEASTAEVPSRSTNGSSYRPTLEDTERFRQFMFHWTKKSEKPETAQSWLKQAARAGSYAEIENFLEGQIKEYGPPRNNAWFHTCIENEFDLSPEGKTALVEEMQGRFREAVKLLGQDGPSECQRLIEEAANAGIPAAVVMAGIGRRPRKEPNGGGAG